MFKTSFTAVVAACLLGTLASASDRQPADLSAQRLIEAPVLGGGYVVKRASVSPDGSMVAFQVARASVFDNEYKLSWYVLDLTEGGRAPKYVADGGDVMLNIRQRNIPNGTIVDGVARWAPDSKWIAFVKQVGNEIQVWRAHATDGRVEQLTRNEANIFGSTAYDPLFEWSEDGSLIFFEVARRREEMAGSLEDEGRRGFLFNDRFYPGAQLTPTWSRCGQSRRAQASLAGQECVPTLWVYSFREQTERLATTEEAVEYQSIQFLANQWIYDKTVTTKQVFRESSGRVASLENIDLEQYRGFLPPVQVTVLDGDGNHDRCAHDVCIGAYIEDLWLIEREVIFLRRESQSAIENLGFLAFYGWNPETDGIRLIKKTSDHYEGCAEAAGSLICYHENPTTPRRLIRMNVSSGDDVVIFAPAADLTDFLSPQVEHLELQDGERFTYAKLVFPVDYVEGQRYPLVIVQGHLRGFLEGGSGNEFPVHLFAHHGFFVLNASPYQQVAPLETLPGESLSEYEFRTFRIRINALDAYSQYIAMLSQRGLVDRARVAITGLSSGSVNARYGMIHSDLYAVAALSTGYSGPQQYWNLPSEFRDRLSRVYFDGSLPFEAPAEDFFSNEQLGWHARTVDFPPTLWQVSDSELSHAVFDHNLLYDEGQPVEMYVFPDAYHIKHQPVHRYNVYRRNVQWMLFWLQGETMADSVDPAQYDRWNALCAAYVERFNASGQEGIFNDRCLKATVE